MHRRAMASGLILLAVLAGVAWVAGCASRPDGVSAKDAGSAGSLDRSSEPIVLTGVSLLTDAAEPKLLFTASAPLRPMTFSREDGQRVVIDLPDTVPASGLEPPRLPRGEGTILAALAMRSFTEMGHPHVQFELTGHGPIESSLGTEPGSSAMAVTLLSRSRAAGPDAVMASSAGPTPQARASAESELAVPETVQVQDLDTAPSRPTTSAPPAFVASTVETPDVPKVLERAVPSGKPATHLSTIKGVSKNGEFVVTLTGDGAFGYETFALENPPRYVVDLQGVRNSARTKSQEVASRAVSRLRVSQFRAEPSPVTRVVFDLSGEAQPQLRQTSAGLQVVFGATATASSPSSPTQVASATPVATIAQNQAPVSKSPVEPVKAPKPAVSSKPLGESVESSAISKVGRAPVAPAAGSYEAHEDEPEGAATPAPVVAASSVIPPKPPLQSSDHTVPTTDLQKPAMPAPVESPAVASGRPVDPPVRTVDAGSIVADSPKTPVPAPAVPKAEPEKVSAPPELVVYSPETRPSTDNKRSSKKARSAEDRSLLEAAEALLVQQERAKPKEVGDSFEPRILGSGEKEYTGEAISLNLKDADLKDTLQKFSEITQLNVIIDQDVRGTVTVSLNDVPWDQALELILKISRLGYVLEGNIMRIMTTRKLIEEEAEKGAIEKAKEQSRPVKTIIQPISYATASSLTAIVKGSLSPRGDVIVDARTNSMIIKDLPEYLPVAIDLIRSLDKPAAQVMIEARIVEATRTFSKSLGISWTYAGVADAAHGNTTGLVFPNRFNVGGDVNLPQAGNNILRLGFGNVLDTIRLDVALQAAESRGLIKLVGSPKIQTTQNIQASIQSGTQIPVQTTVNNTTSVQYIDATLRLDVTPQITAEGTISLDIKIQRKEPAPGANVTQGGNTPLLTREAKTTLLVRDGGTSVIGGIFRLSSNDSRNMIPGLWKIPLLGNLFRNNAESENTDELMIFITPRIMKNS